MTGAITWGGLNFVAIFLYSPLDLGGFVMNFRWTWVSGSVSMCSERNDLLDIILKGLNLLVVLEDALIIMRAVNSR